MTDFFKQNVENAKGSVKHYIDMLHEILGDLQSSDMRVSGRAVVAAHCLDRYINEDLVKEMADYTDRMINQYQDKKSEPNE